MSEWLKEHAWKACVGETLPWVRIPLSPPDFVLPSQQSRSRPSGIQGRKSLPVAKTVPNGPPKLPNSFDVCGLRVKPRIQRRISNGIDGRSSVLPQARMLCGEVVE